MTIHSFADFQAQIQGLYQKREYAKALELSLQNASRFPDEMPIVRYWQFSMAARLGDTARAFQILADTLADGFWYSEPLLRKSPSLLPLQGNPGFEQLVEQNRQQQLQDQEQLFPVIVLRQQGGCQDPDHPCPVLVALHANSSTAQASVDFWKPAASAGWLVAVPQSSQAMWKDAYTWDDMETTLEETQRHFSALEAQYALDAARVVIAGQSIGAEAALRLALGGVLDACGFIALGLDGAWMAAAESWNELILQDQERRRSAGVPRLRGYFLYGEEDQSISPAAIQALAEKLAQAGTVCQVESLPEVGAGYHPAYAPALLRALDFILENS